MSDTTRYPISGDTGLPALPEGYRWFITKGYSGFEIHIQNEKNTGTKIVELPRNWWEKLTFSPGRQEYREVTLTGEDRWDRFMSQPILTVDALSKPAKDEYDDEGFYVSEYVRVLTPEVILANARALVALFDARQQAKASEKYLGAYPPGKINQ